MQDMNRTSAINFYPRSPCGERHGAAEGARPPYDFYPRSPCGERPTKTAGLPCMISSFLSTLSLRRATINFIIFDCTEKYFYPRSPCGERQHPFFVHLHKIIFLSTLSLRRATQPRNIVNAAIGISIHALLAESDLTVPDLGKRDVRFLSTLSLRRATHCPAPPTSAPDISIHALLAESDIYCHCLAPPILISIHALLAESDRHNTQDTTPIRISIHALLAESDDRAPAAR